MPSFTVGLPDGDRIHVTLLGAPANPETEGYDWIPARVAVRAGGFSGQAEVQLCVSDIVRFHAQLASLSRDLHGTAELHPIEEQLHIHIAIDKLGHVQATGYLLSDLISGNRLEFDLRFDQTSLTHTLHDLNAALATLAKHQ